MSYTNSSACSAIAGFFDSLKTKVPGGASVKQFLLNLRELIPAPPYRPGEPAVPEDPAPGFSPEAGPGGLTPVLRDIAELCAGAAAAKQGGVFRGPGILAERLDRRYRRVCIVQAELGRLDLKKADPGAELEDFVFGETDFSAYNQIPETVFRALYLDGLNDFRDGFFVKAFGLERAAAAAAIARGYQKIGPVYYSRNPYPEGNLRASRSAADPRRPHTGSPNPLMLSLMRTLETSLEFAPLFTQEEILRECNGLIRFLRDASILGGENFFYLAQNFRALFGGILRGLHNAAFTHPDGMVTVLTASPAANAAVLDDAVTDDAVTDDAVTDDAVTLRGIFHPAGKAYTLPLISAGRG
jgi:hypothetical protein